MSDSCFVATVGAVYTDGVSLVLPGTEQATSKHYKANAACPLKAGDRVKVSRIGNSFLVDYRITGKATAGQATVLIDDTLTQAGLAADAAAVGSGLDKLKNELSQKTGEIEREILTNAEETERELSQKADKTQLCSPNLLDNWYFGNPVNQREKTSYSGSGYGFDRWRTNVSSDTVEKTDAGIKNTVVQTSRGWHLHQRIETDSYLIGKTVTASVLVEDVLGVHTSLIISCRGPESQRPEIAVTFSALHLGLTTATIQIPDNCAYIYVGIYAYDGTQVGESFTLRAAKLELGSEQTLAHQENGVWVLNEIPDYGEQLRRCQRFFRKLGGESDYALALNGYISNGGKDIVINSGGEEMRVVPTVTATPALGTSPSGIVIRTDSGYAPDASYAAPYSTPVFSCYDLGQTLAVRKNDTSAWAGATNNTLVGMSARNLRLYLSADL